MREIAILGATGSIGTQALDVIARHSGDFRVSALTAHSNANELFAYVRRFRPRFAGLVREAPFRRTCAFASGSLARRRTSACFAPQSRTTRCARWWALPGLPAVMAALEVCERVLLANQGGARHPAARW